MGKYVIYARKSSESEDRQVLSIESQVHELRQLALRHGVEVDEVLTESHSAKAPGRPIFTELIRRIGRGDVTGILCWKLDRLARNPYDSGVILQAQADGKLERIITNDRSEQHARATQLREQVDLVHGGPLVIEHGDAFQLRSLLQQLQLEIRLRGRRLDFTAPKPLSILVEAGSNSAWRAQGDSNPRSSP